MMSVKREPIRGIWGCAPSGVQGQSPWSGGQGAKPPEADDILIIKTPYFAFNCIDESVFLESELVKISGLK